MSSSIRLIAVDLDFTLLNSRFRVSERNGGAITRVVDSGAIITLATGRMYASALPFARILGLDAPLIAYNGAYIRSAGSDRVFSHIPVKREHAASAIRLAAAEGLHCNIYIDDKLYMSKEGWESRMYTTQCGVAGEYIPDLEGLMRELDKRPTKMLLIGEEHRMAGVQAQLGSVVSGNAYVTRSLPHYVELMHSKASKGNALRHLCGMLGVRPQETMAIGDSYNDVEMLRFAGVGVAMANSPGELKAVAEFVAPSNDEDGVAVALETYSGRVGA